MAEVASHNTLDDIWICISGQAYNITPYVSKHPGGVLPLENLAGKDVTDAFRNYHPDYVFRKILPSF
jgi:cytochrome b involved in lipid metabolism